MDIQKEVFIRAHIDLTWNFISKTDNLNQLLKDDIDPCFNDNGVSVFSASDFRRWTVDISRPHSISLSARKELDKISIKISLLPYNNRTLLKLVVSGWKKTNKESTRKMIPRVSLVWEKRLKKIKKILEDSGNKNPAAAQY